MKGKLVIWLILICLLFNSVTVIASEDKEVNIISIPPQVQVKRLQVTLGEIANIKGTNTFYEQVKDISLGRAPLPDYKRTLYRQMIINLLKEKGINLARVKFNIPYQFTVTSNFKEMAVEKLIESGKDYIYNNLPYSADQIKIEPVAPPRNLKCPYGDVEFEIEDRYGNLLGSTMLPVKIMVDGQTYREIYLQYKVKLWKEVLVARENLKRNQPLERDMFAVKKRAIGKHNQQFVSPETDLEGKQLKHSLQAGQILLKRMVELPPLVKRWKEVTIVAKVNGVEVTTTGKSLEPGHKGEIIKVQNQNSQKTVKAKVIGENKVQVIIN